MSEAQLNKLYREKSLFCSVTYTATSFPVCTGVVCWTPFAGILLVSRGQSLAQITLVMLLFGIGASLPPVILRLLSREVDYMHG